MAQTWPCAACTYINPYGFERCQMCRAHRGPPTKTKPLPLEKSKAVVIDLSSPASMESAKSRKRRRQNNTEPLSFGGKKETTLLVTGGHDDSSRSNEPAQRISASACHSLSHPSKSNAIQQVTKVGVSFGKKQGNNVEFSKSGISHPTKSSSSTNISQTTLFGNIVKNIQDTDVSTVPKKKKMHVPKTKLIVLDDDEPDDDSLEESTFPSRGISKQININSMRQEKKIQSYTTPRSINTTTQGSLMERARQVMKKHFKIDSLRNLQPEAVDGALKGQSQILVMATGQGKSLCYQLPATVLPGITIVLSPLIALMVDQVQSLNSKDIPAALMSSANGERENMEVMQRLVGRRSDTKQSKHSKALPPLKPIKLLYCTPELMETTRFRAILNELYKNGKLSLFAIDEAHCLSTWGHDFRPAYRKLSWIRTSFPDIPCMACTATATAKVIQDIRETLLMNPDDVPCRMSSFNRGNISYEVRFKDTLDQTIQPLGAKGDLVSLIKTQHAAAAKDNLPCSGIIYVHKRSDAGDLAQHISKATKIKAAPYHAGLSDSQRKDTQRKWTDGTISIAVATVAFGMGIDLGHVKYVIHWAMAKSVEGFYQESGRAGRDGKNALSILYYSKDDASKFAFLIKKNQESKRRKKGASANSRKESDAGLAALQGMIDYCTKACCRRQFLLKHFGETIDSKTVCKKTCDYCQDPKKVANAIEMSQVVKQAAAGFRRSKFFSTTTKTKAAWDGQWDQPHGSSFSDEEDIGNFSSDWDDGIESQGIQDASSLESSHKAPLSTRFSKASDILGKFEVMECQEGKQNGFVNFKAKSSSLADKRDRLVSAAQKPVVIPNHMRANMPDPLASFQRPKESSSNEDARGSAEIGSDLERLKADLARMKEQRDALAKRRSQSSTPTGRQASSSLPPPPPLSFRGSDTKHRDKRRK